MNSEAYSIAYTSVVVPHDFTLKFIQITIKRWVKLIRYDRMFVDNHRNSESKFFYCNHEYYSGGAGKNFK